MKTKLRRGYTVGRIYVLGCFYGPWMKDRKRPRRHIRVKCLCECGTIWTVMASNLYKTVRCCRFCAKHVFRYGDKVRGAFFIEYDRRFRARTPRGWLRCECGSFFSYSIGGLRRRTSPIYCLECSKKKTKKYAERKRIEASPPTNYRKHLKAKDKWVGFKVNKIEVIAFSHWQQVSEKYPRRRPFYLVKCECGKLFTKRVDFLSDIYSCGCEKRPFNPLRHLSAELVEELKELYSTEVYSLKELSSIYQKPLSVIKKILKK